MTDAVSLSLNGEGKNIELAITDNGKGFTVEGMLTKEGSRRGLGLESMRERRELSGGFHYPISAGPRNRNSSLLACRTTI